MPKGNTSNSGTMEQVTFNYLIFILFATSTNFHFIFSLKDVEGRITDPETVKKLIFRGVIYIRFI